MQKLSIVGVMASVLFVVVTVRMISLQQGLPSETTEVDSRSAELFEALQTHGMLPEQAGADGQISLPAEDSVLAQQAAGSPLPELAARQKLLNRLYGRLHGRRVQKQVGLWNLGQQMAAVRDDRPQADDGNAWMVGDAVTGRGLSSTAMLAADFVYVGTDRLRGGFHDWRTSTSDNPLSFSTTFVLAEPGTVQIQIIGGTIPESERTSTDQPAAATISRSTCKPALDTSRYSFAWDGRRLRGNSRNPLDTEKA